MRWEMIVDNVLWVGEGGGGWGVGGWENALI